MHRPGAMYAPMGKRNGLALNSGSVASGVWVMLLPPAGINGW
ncbi:hypothetical protein [Pectobacterium carotovorum]|nr:hypothetical protein [Pectobacterium carotovorum]